MHLGGRVGRALGTTLLAAVSVVSAPVAAVAQDDRPSDERSTESSARTVLVAARGIGGGARQLQHLGTRTSGDGVTLRTYLGDVDQVFVGLQGAPLPAECFPDLSIDMQTSTKAIAQSVTFSARTGEAFPAQGQVIGLVERAPVAVAVAMLPEGSTSAQMRFAGGRTDAAPGLPGGWVALASRVRAADPTGPTRTIGTITYRDAAGVPVATETVAYGFGATPRETVECGNAPRPPLIEPLPPATGPPPADPTAAEAEVVTAYRTVFDGNPDVTPEERLAAIEGGETLRASVERAVERAGERFPDVGATKAVVGDVTFLNDHEAALRYSISKENGDPLSKTLIGRAVLVDGTWRVTTSTWCEMLVSGGTQCP
ncbi:MAG: hypothetical protein WEC34_01335 [Acidimicrobiia bacterium]